MNKKILIEKDIEILTKTNNIRTIRVFNDQLIQNDINNNTNYTLKAKIDNKYIFLSTESLENPNKLIDTLKSNASLLENTDESSFGEEEIVDDKKINKKYDLNNIIPFFKELASFKNEYDNLYTIECTAEEVSSNIEIENKNIHSKDNNHFYTILIEFIVKNKELSVDERIIIIDKNINEEKIKNKVRKGIEETVKRLDYKSAITNNYKVLLTNSVVSDILGSFTEMFSAKNTRDNISPLSGKFNKTVFNDKITIIEDPTNINFPTKRLFDSEGTKTYKKEIIKNGKFITKLYDNQSAKLENVKSTGNSFGIKNLYINPGNKSRDELEYIIDEGFIITNVEGMHSGIIPKTGTISVQARGIYIKDGKKEYIEQLILSTNIFEMLNNIIEVGNDLEFYNLSLGAPSLLLNDIMIIAS